MLKAVMVMLSLRPSLPLMRVQKLINILKIRFSSLIASREFSMASEWPPESCTYTLFREAFLKRFNEDLQPKKRVFKDEKNRNEAQASLQTAKREHF